MNFIPNLFFSQLGLMRDISILVKRYQRKVPAVKDQSDMTTWISVNKVINEFQIPFYLAY